MRPSLRDPRGVATLELALVTPLLLVVLLGIIEFGNALSIDHTITSLSREGANIASRGSALGDAVQTVAASGSSISLDAHGGVIGTRLVVQGGTPVIADQEMSPGYSGVSRLGALGDPVPSMVTLGLDDGMTVFVMEVFYQYQAMTPLGDLVEVSLPQTIYERAVF